MWWYCSNRKKNRFFDIKCSKGITYYGISKTIRKWKIANSKNKEINNNQNQNIGLNNNQNIGLNNNQNTNNNTTFKINNNIQNNNNQNDNFQNIIVIFKIKIIIILLF